MDITIRKHEHCVIGLPRCDFVFSSTRTCFIAYGFDESNLEMSLLRKLLAERGVECVEAGGSLAPGQSAYCAKICSKIITSQFCIVLLNNSEPSDGREVPSANVNMEYGLMLGFNKYVIPFQRAAQKLPFNVAGLDTIKYGTRDFERLATDAIEQAIVSTTQHNSSAIPVDQSVETFLMTKRALLAPLQEQGERNISELGRPLGFVLLNDFSGNSMVFFGHFTALRPETAIWRLRTLDAIMVERLAGTEFRLQFQETPAAQIEAFKHIFRQIPLWIIVTSENEKETIVANLNAQPIEHAVSVFTVEDVNASIIRIGAA